MTKQKRSYPPIACEYCGELIRYNQMMRHKEAFHKLELRKELAPLRDKWRKELGLPPLENNE